MSSIPGHFQTTIWKQVGMGFPSHQTIAPAVFQGIPPGGEQHAQFGWGVKTLTDQQEAQGRSSG